MAQEATFDERGIYNVEYFSGVQVSLFIGDIWVDEVTSISFGYQQSRKPIFGYASTLYDDLSEGQVLIQGAFTLNFKEAGYLWLIQDRYREKIHQNRSLTEPGQGTPFESSKLARQENIENLVNGQLSVYDRNKALQDLASKDQVGTGAAKLLAARRDVDFANSAALRGFSDIERSDGMGKAEGIFEEFEDAVWGKKGTENYLLNRRSDDPRLNPFDIYLAYGDYAGDGTVNHTILRLDTVTILGKSQQIVVDGMPIQEQYSFIARDLV